MMHKINVVVFFSAMAAGFASFFILPPKKISYEEKRKLASLPTLDWDGYVNGTFADSVDQYINDQFPFRQKLVDIAGVIKYNYGIHFKNEEKIFVAKKKNTKETAVNQKEEFGDTNMRFLDDFEEAYSGSMLILNGSVYPLSGGSPKMGRVFAGMVSDYAQKLKGHTRVFSCVAPLSSAFIPAEKYRQYNHKNKKTLEAIGNSLTNGAIFSDVFRELNAHAKEKMFFSTDHHWNAIGAYYAYVAFCKSAGYTPIPREKMTKKVKYNFVGSLYRHTRDKSVLNNPDTMVYWVPKVPTTVTKYPASGFKGSPSKLFCETCSGGGTYSTFICGDIPLIKISTNIKNGKKAAVIKNSMGNAFAVYLVSHYEEIWVVDLRYSRHNLMNIIMENDVDDLIFAIGMYAAMSNGTIRMMRNLATQRGGGGGTDGKGGIPKNPKKSNGDSTIVLPDPVDVNDSLR
jgi:hypothetical protein